jgi:hypothetical protein
VRERQLRGPEGEMDERQLVLQDGNLAVGLELAVPRDRLVGQADRGLHVATLTVANRQRGQECRPTAIVELVHEPTRLFEIRERPLRLAAAPVDRGEGDQQARLEVRLDLEAAPDLVEQPSEDRAGFGVVLGLVLRRAQPVARSSRLHRHAGGIERCGRGTRHPDGIGRSLEATPRLGEARPIPARRTGWVSRSSSASYASAAFTQSPEARWRSASRRDHAGSASRRKWAGGSASRWAMKLSAASHGFARPFSSALMYAFV